MTNKKYTVEVTAEQTATRRQNLEFANQIRLKTEANEINVMLNFTCYNEARDQP